MQSDLKQLIQLTQESLDASNAKHIEENSTRSVQEQSQNKNDLDEQYSLFMVGVNNCHYAHCFIWQSWGTLTIQYVINRLEGAVKYLPK